MSKLSGLQLTTGKCMTVLGAILLATVAHAQTAIKSVNATLQGGVEVVRVDFSQPLPVVPSGFVIQSPARIAFDFPRVTTALGRAPIELNTGNLRSANVIQVGERSRLVLNLKESAGYEAKLDGSTLLVLLQKSGDSSNFQEASKAESVVSDVSRLTDIDFRRGTDNVGRVVVDFSDSQVGVDIKQLGNTLAVEFLKTSLPEGLRRRLDVSDFGTPVQTVVSSQVGDKVRMVVTPKGNWEHSAYQTDKQFVLEIREQKTDPSKLTQGKGFNGETLSLNFQNIEVRSLLQVIADFTNFNIVTSDSVTGTLTLRLKDVPWDQALEIILQAKGLGMRKAGNVIWIAPGDEIAAREKSELESKASIESLESVKTQGFQMNYAKAVDIAAQLNASQAGATAVASPSSGTGNNGRMLSPRGSVIAEPRTNQLFVTDIPSRLEQIQQFIAKLDIPVRQVLIEARIVEADDKFGKSLGVRLGGSDLRGVRGGDAGYALGSANRVAIGGTYNAVSTTTGEGVTPLDTANTSFINLPALGLGGVSPASFAVSLFSASANRFLNLEISALEADSRGKIVSSPRVVTADQVKAVIEQGVEYPYQTTAPNGGTTISFKKAGLKLEVTPQITPEGHIILDVEVNKDSPGEILSGARAINTKRVQTQVLVENGGTVVIGGIFESIESNAESKVPFLGDLPLMGNLFKSRNNTANKSEMLVFITPKVIAR